MSLINYISTVYRFSKACKLQSHKNKSLSRHTPRLEATALQFTQQKKLTTYTRLAGSRKRQKCLGTKAQTCQCACICMRCATNYCQQQLITRTTPPLTHVSLVSESTLGMWRHNSPLTSAMKLIGGGSVLEWSLSLVALFMCSFVVVSADRE